MSRKPSRANQQILEEASAWFVTFRSQEPAGPAAREFHDWLKQSPEHIRAYLEIAAIYAEIPAPAQGRTPADLIARAKASADPNVISLKPRIETQQPKRFATRFALAASVLICVLMSAWFYAGRNIYDTGIGEQRSITLEDGSIVELNARSKVRIAYRERQRDVELLEGQALFRVAKDHHRPFVVHAGTASVRAVGTQFDVNRKSEATTVTVLEGRVAVESSRVEAPGSAPTIAPDQSELSGEVFLVSGEQMTVTPTDVRKAERPNVAAATAWTQHLLVFDGTALSEVLEEFKRHTTRRIVVDSPELAALKISGQYTSTNPDSLLRFLSLQPGVTVDEVNGEIHVRKE